MPASWRARRFKVPAVARLHHADVPDVPDVDRTWSGPVPVTTPQRMGADCFADHAQPDLVDQGVRDDLRRGLYTAADLREAGVAA